MIVDSKESFRIVLKADNLRKCGGVDAAQLRVTDVREIQCVKI